LSGLRKAYRSVLSATGSLDINGASLWLEAINILLLNSIKTAISVLYILMLIVFIFINFEVI